MGVWDPKYTKQPSFLYEGCSMEFDWTHICTPPLNHNHTTHTHTTTPYPCNPVASHSHVHTKISLIENFIQHFIRDTLRLMELLLFSRGPFTSMLWKRLRLAYAMLDHGIKNVKVWLYVQINGGLVLGVRWFSVIRTIGFLNGALFSIRSSCIS